MFGAECVELNFEENKFSHDLRGGPKLTPFERAAKNAGVEMCPFVIQLVPYSVAICGRRM